jgi:glycosyltransferase involved in cell wall biosynthesis
MPDLAIIIPAFKIDFFEEALNSLASQTNKNFNVYVGDDCSPYNLEAISEKFKEVLNIFYKKFEVNIGSKNLVNQWERSINLSQDEKWIWLFSDDDIADTHCVENFLELVKINDDRFDVYRFNVSVINKNGELIRSTPEGPFEETSEEMAYHLLRNERGNSMPDHIFSRGIFIKKGLVFTDYAQGADWAISILFSSDKGIAIIPGAKVFWRSSGLNISSGGFQRRNKMLPGYLQFTKWLINHFSFLQTSASGVTYEMILQGARISLRNTLVYHYKGFTLKNLIRVVKVMRENLRMTYREIWTDIYFIVGHTNRLAMKSVRIKLLIKNFLHSPDLHS